MSSAPPTAGNTPKHTNRLARETSPYLLQHAHNPVDWFAWGPEALAAARAADKPIFLSIGYSACHWCHVMERESFENEEVAALMNSRFVNIKVDREERPDLDDIYMKATHAVSGHGGWPMSVWLTPDLQPFHAGTYFPLLPRYGMPGFAQVLSTMAQMWVDQRPDCLERAQKITDMVRKLSSPADTLPSVGPDARAPELGLISHTVEQLGQGYDPQWGGFGGAPKFPQADNLRLLLRQYRDEGDHPALRMAEHTLDCMARGGIHDQLGGGFARYSTDERWWIPHFEKMLYDNALLLTAYVEAWRIDKRDDFLDVAAGVCAWVAREMTGTDGGFYSTQDADSEGEEGRFFVWTPRDVHRLVGDDCKRLVDVAWNLGAEPNFEGRHWVLVRPKPDAELARELGLEPEELRGQLRDVARTLFAERAKRVAPGTDDKVLVSWNGLMIGALAKASVVLEDPDALALAQRAADFCLTTMRPDGRRLMATARAGKVHLNGTLADYSYLASGLLDLFEADGDPRWAAAAHDLADVVGSHFADPDSALWFFTSDDHEELVARPRDLHDGATPSSVGVQIEVLVRLADLTGERALQVAADRALATLEPMMQGSPGAFSRALLALMRAATGTPTVVVARGEGFAGLWRLLAEHPDGAMAAIPVPAAGVAPDIAARFGLLAAKTATDGKATAYVCRAGTCQQPVTTVEELRRQLD